MPILNTEGKKKERQVRNSVIGGKGESSMENPWYGWNSEPAALVVAGAWCRTRW